ncbi:carbon storage regulator CsrA [Bellilinea sp.]|jgi:carbon storage regulator|uniref:Translational regulator CsrA n=1 Tax=Bellilinea caldifistulae TaxID=360411 RepID=A0A7C4Q414_9CHLR|nr:carbon storage regulator CsrA [Bellilinea sp.]
MLVLTRRVDESIAIGDSITVTVLAVEGDRVKLGITAPREVLILRQEVADAVKEQTRLQELLASGPEPESFEALRKLLADESPDPQPGEAPESPDQA